MLALLSSHVALAVAALGAFFVAAALAADACAASCTAAAVGCGAGAFAPAAARACKRAGGCVRAAAGACAAVDACDAGVAQHRNRFAPVQKSMLLCNLTINIVCKHNILQQYLRQLTNL